MEARSEDTGRTHLINLTGRRATVGVIQTPVELDNVPDIGIEFRRVRQRRGPPRQVTQQVLLQNQETGEIEEPTPEERTAGRRTMKSSGFHMGEGKLWARMLMGEPTDDAAHAVVSCEVSITNKAEAMNDIEKLVWTVQDFPGAISYDIHAAMQHVHVLKMVWHYLDAVPGMKRPVAQCIGGLRGRVVCENRTPVDGIYCVACVKRLWIQ